MATKTKFQAIKGTRDLLPLETELWNRVEQTAREVFSTYGFGEIRLPIFEPTELFARAVGGETDIVSKEMYSFPDPFDRFERAAQILSSPSRIPGYFGMNEEQRSGAVQKEIDSLPNGEWISLRPEATASVCR